MHLIYTLSLHVRTKNPPEVVNLIKLSHQPFDYYIILDFEATCDNNKKIKPQEIIEFPSVLVSAKTLQVEEEFQVYVKPTANPILTDFCTKLTGIQQNWVDQGITLPQALLEYDKWLRSKGLLDKYSFAFVTCGDWDLNSCLKNQCNEMSMSKPSYFNSWINIKKLYSNFYNSKMVDMVAMLTGLKLPLVGRHHSGIDDCRNIARIFIKLLSDGAIADITGKLK